MDISPPLNLLARVINSMLWIVKSPFTTAVTLTDGRIHEYVTNTGIYDMVSGQQKPASYHIRLLSHFIVHSRNTDGPTVLYIHDSRTILTVYEGLAQARQ